MPEIVERKSSFFSFFFVEKGEKEESTPAPEIVKRKKSMPEISREKEYTGAENRRERGELAGAGNRRESEESSHKS